MYAPSTHRGQKEASDLVTTIPGCQLDYIWNELQSRNGGHTCDLDCKSGRYRLLTQILTWRS